MYIFNLSNLCLLYAIYSSSPITHIRHHIISWFCTAACETIGFNKNRWNLRSLQNLDHNGGKLLVGASTLSIMCAESCPYQTVVSRVMWLQSFFLELPDQSQTYIRIGSYQDTQLITRWCTCINHCIQDGANSKGFGTCQSPHPSSWHRCAKTTWGMLLFWSSSWYPCPETHGVLLGCPHGAVRWVVILWNIAGQSWHLNVDRRSSFTSHAIGRVYLSLNMVEM